VTTRRHCMQFEGTEIRMATRGKKCDRIEFATILERLFQHLASEDSEILRVDLLDPCRNNAIHWRLWPTTSSQKKRLKSYFTCKPSQIVRTSRKTFPIVPVSSRGRPEQQKCIPTRSLPDSNRRPTDARIVLYSYRQSKSAMLPLHQGTG
jgi:hypothetical protein